MTRRLAFLAPAAVAAALSVCAPAQATSFTGNGSSNIVDGTGAFFDTAIPAGNFTDVIDFTVSSDGTADVGVLYFQMLSGITNLSAFFNGQALTFSNVGGTLYAGGLTASVGAGPQQLVISGTSGGAGAYSGNVAFSAVPEAATWLMMILGVGFTGVALRRRKQTYTVNYAF